MVDAKEENSNPTTADLIGLKIKLQSKNSWPKEENIKNQKSVFLFNAHSSRSITNNKHCMHLSVIYLMFAIEFGLLMR